MKDTFTDANFPRSADGRVYHLGLRAGEVANRILTVGSPSRAESISELLDGGDSASSSGLDSKIFKLSTERGFLTYTGRYKGVPMSVISIGMGYPNMDFFVREVRECLSGDLVIVRLGSCGGLSGLPVGSLVVPTASVAVRRNYDYNFSEKNEAQQERPYEVSKPANADPELHATLTASLKNSQSSDLEVIVASDVVNASADSFYSSQGRLTSFPDHNESLIDYLLSSIPHLASLEMETFHLLHLASVWRPRLSVTAPTDANSGSSQNTLANLPPSHHPAPPIVDDEPSSQDSTVVSHGSAGTLTSTSTGPRIRAAAVQMIFANRQSRDFIDPDRVARLEAWSGRAVLEALVAFHIPAENLHDESGSVWEHR